MIEGRVVVIDDEENICRSCVEILRDDGYEVKAFTEASSALRHLGEESADLVLLDLKMPEVSGIDMLQGDRSPLPGDARRNHNRLRHRRNGGHLNEVRRLRLRAEALHAR